MAYVHNGLSATKKGEILPFITWIDIKSVMLSKKKKSENSNSIYMISYMRNIKKLRNKVKAHTHTKQP